MEPHRWKVSRSDFGLLLVVLGALGSTWFFSFRPLWVLGRDLGTGTLANFLSDLLDPFVLKIAGFTFYQAILSTLLSAAVGLPLGIAYGRWFSRHPNSRLPALLALPYSVPSITAATLWIDWLGRKGTLAQWGIQLDWAYSLKAVLVTHVFFNIPLIALQVAQVRRHLSQTELEAAQSLGANSTQILRSLEWSKVKWAFFSSCSQVFGLCTMSFAIVLLLGGGPPVETLETQIYRAVRFGGVQGSTASACAFWELALTLTPWIITQTLSQKRALKESSAPPRDAQPPGSDKPHFAVIFKGATLFLFALFFVLPYSPLLSPENLSALFHLGFDLTLRGQILKALQFSLLIASAAACIAVGIATCQIKTVQLLKDHQKKLSQLFLLPGGVSALVLALGFWKALPPQIGIDPLVLMILVQISLFIPFAFKQLLPGLVELGPAEVDAARSLGASPWQIFHLLQWPLWKRPIVITIGILLSLSLGEMGAVSLFATTDRTPLPILIHTWMETYQFEAARAISTLILLVSGVSLFLFDRLSSTDLSRSRNLLPQKEAG